MTTSGPSRQFSYSDETFLHALSSPSSPSSSPSSSSSSPSSPSSSSSAIASSSSFPLCSSLHQHRHSLPKINPSSAKVSKGKSPFLCKFCQKGFPRHEHMLRHERKHTGERPFKCWLEDCPKRFSRFDNMMQHFRTHASSADFATAAVRRVPKKLAEAEAALEREQRAARHSQEAATSSEQGHRMSISHIVGYEELEAPAPLLHRQMQRQQPPLSSSSSTTSSPSPLSNTLSFRTSSSNLFSSMTSSSSSSSMTSSSAASSSSSTPSSFSQLLEQPQLSSLAHFSHLSHSSPRSSPSTVSWLSTEEASPSPLSQAIEFSRVTPPPARRDSFDTLLLKKFKGPL